MQKIMFNDRYVLTQGVIEGRKTTTRRIEGDGQFQLAATAAEDITCEEDAGCIVMCCQGIAIFRHKCRYNVGEVVAVAQSYENAGVAIVPNRYDGSKWGNPKRMQGYRNKLYVRPELMPHQIRIMGIKCERLQEISDEDCMKEGVQILDGRYYYRDNGGRIVDDFGSPRAAFASLFDKVSGRGTWKRNQWVVVYEFELVK